MIRSLLQRFLLGRRLLLRLLQAVGTDMQMSRVSLLLILQVSTALRPMAPRWTRRVAIGNAALAYSCRPLAAWSEDGVSETADGSTNEQPVSPAPPGPPAPPVVSAFDFDVPFRGEPREIVPFLGRATVFVNVKFDDPETLDQMPGLNSLMSTFGSQGLHVLAFPTDQGWFEADDSNTLRLKYKSVYGFGQFPSAVVFDKVDLLGRNALPLYDWLTKTLVNPWGVSRLVFNYEKILVDAKGQPLRRYPRKFPAQLMEPDVSARDANRVQLGW